MEQPPAAVRIEDLLAHREWVRRMARALVQDDARADDLEQEVWTSALERPPQDRGLPLRGWLATVLRFRAIDQRRADTRRRSREESVARDEREPAAEEVVARGEMVKHVVMAVMDLDEPYRSTVLLRYFEDLPPAAVAERQGVPLETVRTRLRRTLALLRERLDGDHRGERRSWIALLIPLTGTTGGGLSKAATPAGLIGPATFVAGAWAMGVKAKAFLVGACAVLVLGGWWLLEGDSDREAGGGAGSIADALPGGVAKGPVAPQQTASAEGEGRVPAEPPEPGDRSRGILRGTVVAADGRTPAPGIEVKVLPYGGPVPDGMMAPPNPFRARVARSDARGRFVVQDVPVGAWTLEAADPALGRGRETGIAGDDPPWAVVVLGGRGAATRPLRVRVVDESGDPVPGARVESEPGRGPATGAGTTDAAGRVVLEVDLLLSVDLTASKGGAAVRAFVGYAAPPDISVHLGGDPPGREFRIPRGGEVPLTLRVTGSLAGRVLGPPGVPVDGTVVEAWPARSAVRGVPREAAVDAGGAYRIDGLPAGEYTMLVRSPGGLRVHSPVAIHPNSGGTYLDLPTASVSPGEVTTFDLPLEQGGTIRGRVERPDGSPVSGCRVELHLPLGNFDGQDLVEQGGVPLWRLDAEPWGDDRRPASSWIVVATGADGTYESRGLVPAPNWRVRAVPGPGLAFDLRKPVAVEAGRTVDLLHRVTPAGTLEALLPPFWSCALRRAGEEACRAAFVSHMSSGAVRIPGLAAGDWEILTVRRLAKVEYVPAGTFSIRPGETTFLDLSGADLSGLGISPVALRFEQGGRPVEGVEVQEVFARGVLRSGPDGSVRTRGWVRTDAWAAQEAPTMAFSFRAPDPDATPLAWQPAMEGGGSGNEWRKTVPIPSGRLLFRCVDASGRPCAGVSVTLGLWRPSMSGGGASPDRTVRRGRVLGPGDIGPTGGGGGPRLTDGSGVACFATLPAAQYGWNAVFPDGGGASGEVALEEEGESVEVPVTGAETGSLRVTVLLPHGRPAAGASVILLRSPPPDPDPPPVPAPGGGGFLSPDSRAGGFGGWAGNDRVPIPKGTAGDDGVLVVRGVTGKVWVAAVPRGRSLQSLREVGEVTDAVEVPFSNAAEVPVTVRLKTRR